MFTVSGAQGSWRRALRAVRLWQLALLGVLALALAGGATPPSTGQVVLSGYGGSDLASDQATNSSPAIPRSIPNGSFTIAGTVSGLYPGVKRTLVLKVTNPQSFPIVVTSLKTAVHNASASCAGPNLTVSSFAGQLSVPAHGSAKTSVLATLVQGAPNACKGAKFPLVYSGLGKQA